MTEQRRSLPGVEKPVFDRLEQASEFALHRIAQVIFMVFEFIESRGDDEPSKPS